MIIAIEGIDGAGKSTVAHLLYERLKPFAVLLREPGSTELAEEIRRLLETYPKDIYTELFLYEASRASLMHEKILPSLAEGKLVILDRSMISTIIYQGYLGGVPINVIEFLNSLATRGRKPTITFWIDVPPEVAYKRKGEKPVKELIKLRDAFLFLMEQGRYKIVRVDGQKSKEEVVDEILSHLRSYGIQVNQAPNL